jgi:hypothetical protein
MFNRTLRRPMFRRGGSTSSAGTGITSGLQAPRQGYEGTGNASDQNVQKDLRDMSIEEIQAYTESLNKPKPRNNTDLFIDFGLDLISRPGSGGSIFQNIGASGQKAYNQYRTANTASDNKLDDRRSDLFTSLIGAQAKMKGSEGASKLLKDEKAAKWLATNIPKMYEIQGRIDDGTATKQDLIQLQVLEDTKSNYAKPDIAVEILMKMYQESNPTALGDKMELFILNDQKLDKENRKYTGPNDPQILKDAVAELKAMFKSFGYASGGRAGYANGEMVEEQVTETMMEPQTDNPISYEQLRARLPQEITDDIIQLMSNSAEALEDFAMISTQQDVDQFNKRYSVNLVLPAEA